MNNAFKYWKSNKAEKESDYRYSATEGTCRAEADKGVVNVAGFSNVFKEEFSLKSAVAKRPVSVAVYAIPFQHYESGIFDGDCGLQLDHGVLTVGYGTDGQDFWKVKNSWGKRWGEEGFIRLARSNLGVGKCGIAMQASYPTL